jgi:hypothetical protein
MHISCKSHKYESGHNYAGVIIYQYNGKSDWRTRNGTHCKSGYVVIQDTDSENVIQWMNEGSADVVHRAVYRNAFGESMTDEIVVGECFSIQNGIFENCLSVAETSASSQDIKKMHGLSEHCVRQIVNHWKTAGSSLPKQRNFEVKELLRDSVYSGKGHLKDCPMNNVL